MTSPRNRAHDPAHAVPPGRALSAAGRSVSNGTNGYLSSWGPSLSGCPRGS
ncbi:hypothetical protein ACH9DO_10120 [Kocuria sp. M1N1S27]|uniref:hypothetical protein n=1 Tax=Kocuria kalidii TaxID=3376283 RepID=UPI0037A7B395